MSYDQDRISYSYQGLQRKRADDGDGDGAVAEADGAAGYEDPNGAIDLGAARRHFREFLRNYRQGQNNYVYRDRLLRTHRRTSGDDTPLDEDAPSGRSTHLLSNGCYPSLTVDLAHVGEYDHALLGLLLSRPSEALSVLESAASDALRTLLFEQERREPEEGVDGVQILLSGSLTPTPLRAINAHHMNKLLLIPGIVISSSRIRARAWRIRIRCGTCGDSQTLEPSGTFAGVAIPSRCLNSSAENNCGPAPYAVIPDDSSFVDEQSLKLQELPESVPTGEMPRAVLLSAERGLVDCAAPGTRVGIYGVANLFSSNAKVGVKSLYLKVVGMTTDWGNAGGSITEGFTPAMEESFCMLAQRRDIYDVVCRSIAPSISGSYTVDIKKAIACLLFGGSRKKLPDGMRLRGDINVLLLGDPSTAKSQFLKFVSRAAPIAVYTSGKGSSAAGLTASVVRDVKGEFYLEGGAMVLADGGVVCIDEFDKMRPADRVAIHEAMEQQTISVAKAGITTVLNSRTSVLAAANPVFGRYDDLKSAEENIDLMTTILSRFDLIFLVRDIRDEQRDRDICKHVMGVHMTSQKEHVVGLEDDLTGGLGRGTMMMDDAGDAATPAEDKIVQNARTVAARGGSLDVHTLKKYIRYCRSKCMPVLTDEAGDILVSSYVTIRDGVRKKSPEGNGTEMHTSSSVIPITVRQLEALVRLAESLAKMRLSAEVQPGDVAEALRLFRVSTMAANSTDDDSRLLDGLKGGGGKEMERAEGFLRHRLLVGTIVNKQKIVEEAVSRGYSGMVVAKAVAIMVMRGEIQERNHSRLIKRIK